MNFNKKHRGYDPAQVDKYMEEKEREAQREKAIRVAQKERIDELTEENHTLREQLTRYKEDEEAISKSLIVSQKLAKDMQYDAEKYSHLVLKRAKIFYATWRAYAQTLISSLSPEEVAEFNKLQHKIEELINAYDGNDIAKEFDEGKFDLNQQTAAATVSPNTQQTAKTPNPITRVEQAAEAVIDLREVVQTDLSLEELCAELGLIDKKD